MSEGSRPSVAFIVPALDEEENVKASVEACLKSAERAGLPCGVYVFDDGSTDRTGAILDEMAAADQRVHVIHNPRTMGLGYNWWTGIDLASEDYALFVPGDNEIPEDAIVVLLGQAGKADLIIPSLSGQEQRPFMRRVVSRAYVLFLNIVFGLKIKYYNGPCMLRRKLVQQVRVRTNGFAYMSAILVTLLKRGHSHVELILPLKYRQHGRSKAVNVKNIFSVLNTLGALWWDVQTSGGRPASQA